MLFQPAYHNGYQILRLFQNAFNEDDVSALLSQIGALLDKRTTKIALAFNEAAYPYSKLISLITRCYRAVNGKGGSLVVVHPSHSFARTAASLNLPAVVRIVASEDEL